MAGSRIRSYQGDGEYVFASYCHKDDAEALPLIESLADAGINVWYDEGIDPGDEWPQVIQERIEGCSVFVAFVSAASQQSHNCRKELNEALTLGKPTIPVLLENCEKSRATEALLARLQALKCWEHGAEGECAAELARAVQKQWPAVQDDLGKQEAGGSSAKDGAIVLTPGAKAEGPTKGESAGDDDVSPKPKSPRRLIGTVVAALAAVCVVLLMVFQPWQLPESDDYVQVLLYPEEGASIEDFSADIETVRKRLDLFVGEGLYDMTANSDSVTIEFPKSCLGTMELKNALRCYITRPIELCLVNADDGQAINLARADIVSVTVEEGPVEGLDEAAEQAGLAGNYEVMKMVLSDEFMSKNGEELDTWMQGLRITQDITNSASFYYSPVLRDGSVLYFLDRDQANNPNIPRTVAYNYTHDTLKGPITFKINLDDQVSWETPGEGAFKGENQVPVSALSGKVVLLRYSDSYHANVENITEGAQLDLEMGLKRRFDVLGVPYAFGYGDEEQDGGSTTRYAVIETSWDAITSRYVYMVAVAGSGGLAICADDCQADLQYDSHSVDVRKGQDDTWQIVVAGKGSYGNATTPTGLLAAFSSSLAHGDVVSFMLGDYVALKASYAGLTESGCLLFDKVTTVEGQSVDDVDAAWAAEFYAMCLETWSRMPSGLEFMGGQVIEDGRISDSQSMQVEQLDEYSQIEEAIKKAVPGALVNLEQPYVKVQLDLPVDDNLVHDGLEAARKVFGAVGCRYAEFPYVIVHLVDEEEMQRDTARIGFMRMASAVDGSYELHLFDSVTGDVLESYQEQFDLLIEADVFYSALSDGIDASEFGRLLSTGFSGAGGDDVPVEDGVSQDEGIPYNTRYFELSIPSSWKGRWEVGFDHEFREAMSATNYSYHFRLDGVEEFSIECKEFALDASRSIGSTGKRQVEFYTTDALSEEDSAFIRSSITIKKE